MDNKYCSKCKTTKPVDDFQVLRSAKDGRHSWCSLCYNAYRREKGYNSKYRSADYSRSRRAWDPHRKTIRGRASVLLSSAMKRAISKDLEFDLDLDWVAEKLDPMVCEATGITLSMEIPDGHRIGRRSPSLDRIDSTKGYTKDNTQITCVMYNQAKSDSCHEDVVAMARSLMKKEKVSFV